MTTSDVTRRRVLMIVASAGTVTVAGCVTSGQEPESGDDESTTDISLVTDNQGAYFDPKGLLIDSGTTIRFVPESGSHTATAYHPSNDRPQRIPDGGDAWDTGVLTEGDTPVSVTLTEPGVYDFFCIPHESMGQVGRIVVDEPKDGPATTSPEELPPAAQEEIPSIEQIMDDGSVAGP